MRPVNKGKAPKVYARYGDARHDLAKRIGYYCSYCEMAVRNMIEIEHVHPQKNGGDALDWHNFLLSCKYCNTIKSNKNTSRDGYVWPDIDRTDLIFAYDEYKIIHSKSHLSKAAKTVAEETIALMGLSRAPHLDNQPTPADTRWRSRIEAWDKAKKSLVNWKTRPSQEMAAAIAMTAKGGHYSIWCTVFEGETPVLLAIRKEYLGTV